MKNNVAINVTKTVHTKSLLKSTLTKIVRKKEYAQIAKKERVCEGCEKNVTNNAHNATNAPLNPSRAIVVRTTTTESGALQAPGGRGENPDSILKPREKVMTLNTALLFFGFLRFASAFPLGPPFFFSI